MMRKNLLWVVLVVVMMVMMKVDSSTLHRVGGGEYSWNPNVDMSDWVIHQVFFVGDWLYFGFDVNTHNILQVNKSNYEECIATDFISNVTRGGHDIFQLREPKTYYFICGGYCNQGMKIAITVVPINPASTTTINPVSTTTSFIPSTVFTTLFTAIVAFMA